MTGMPGFMGAPPGGPPMGAPPGGPPDAKRQRRAEGLVLEPEEDFLQKYSGPSKVGLQNMHTVWLCCHFFSQIVQDACCMAVLSFIQWSSGAACTDVSSSPSAQPHTSSACILNCHLQQVNTVWLAAMLLQPPGHNAEPLSVASDATHTCSQVQ